MCADNTNINEISNVIASLKSGRPNSNINSKGIDGVSSALITNLPTEIAIPLALLFNKSIAYGQFSISLKLAKICPVYKCDNKLLVNNYIYPFQFCQPFLRFLSVSCTQIIRIYK